MDRNIDSSDRALVACGLLSRNPSPPANDPQGAIRGVTYRITNWGEHYENNRSRTVKDLAWVAIPNRHDGEVYSMIMAHPQAPEIFTAWILLLQVASRCQPRGSLVRDNGRPHTPQTLAIKTRGKTEWFTIALEFLSSPEIGWIQCEQVPCNQNDAAACQQPASVLSPSCQSGDEEQNRTEQKESTPIVPLTLFPVTHEKTAPDPVQALSEQLVQRLNQVYRRRTSTAWSDKEKQALRKVIHANPTPDEIDLLCRYCENHQYARNDILTLLNNWNGEVDRARKHFLKTAPRANGSNRMQRENDRAIAEIEAATARIEEDNRRFA